MEKIYQGQTIELRFITNIGMSQADIRKVHFTDPQKIDGVLSATPLLSGNNKLIVTTKFEKIGSWRLWVRVDKEDGTVYISNPITIRIHKPGT
jgi:hypothetical protein